jgi:hypothetical protein
MAQPSKTGGSRAQSKRSSKANDLMTTVRSQTKRVAERALDQVEDLVVHQKEGMAARLGGLAAALRQTALTLGEGDLDANFGRYAARAAQKVDRVSDYLNENDLRAVARDTKDFARRRPEIFLGSALLAGLMLARFLKSSGPEPRSSYPTAQENRGEGRTYA